jgi:hypothetical protein
MSGLKKITDPWGHEIKYAADKVGRMTSIGNASSATAYADDIAYRAFGGVKSMSLGTSFAVNISMGYDNAARPTSYAAVWSKDDSDIQNAGYSYNNDGTLSGVTNNADTKFTQANKYDFAGRLKTNNVGTSTAGYPFQQTMTYDAFSHLSGRSTTTYTLSSVSFTTGYTNNRDSSATYDNAGNVVSTNPTNDHTDWTLDALGRSRRWEETGPWGSTTQKGGETTYDGDGRPAKVANLSRSYVGGQWETWSSENWYYIYSSVTGQKVTDVVLDGSWGNTHINMGSSTIAEIGSDNYLAFSTNDPVTDSTWGTNSTGEKGPDEGRVEMAALNTSVPPVAPANGMPPPVYKNGGNVGNPYSGCQVEGMPAHCDQINAILHAYNVDVFGKSITRHLKVKTVVWNNNGTIDTSWTSEELHIETIPGLVSPTTSGLCDQPKLTSVAGFFIDRSADSAPTRYPYLNPDVADAFIAAANEILQTGIIGTAFSLIGVNEFFRPYSVQVIYWNEYQANLKADAKRRPRPYPRIKKAAQPGNSNHGPGFAFDTDDAGRRLKDGQTVEQVLNRHGFFRNEPNDDVHFNYKIKPTAQQKEDALNYFRWCMGSHGSGLPME